MSIIIQPAAIPSLNIVTKQKSLLDLIGPEYNYSSKKIEPGNYYSRVVSIPCIQKPKNDFSFSFNNCEDTDLTMPDETIEDKYKRLLICCDQPNESGQDEDDIDKKIANIKSEIKSINKLINKNINGTKFMMAILDETGLEKKDIDLINTSNELLKEFTKSPITEAL